MTVTRTTKLTPEELAELFCNLFSDEQAVFFHEVGTIAKEWPNSGWCGQALSICEGLSPLARETIRKLAEHAQ